MHQIKITQTVIWNQSKVCNF